MFAWGSWKTILPLVLGIVGLIAFGLYSELLSKNPIIPLRIITNRTAAINYFGMFIHGFVQFGITFYLPLYYQGVKGYSPLIAGVAALPQCATAGPSTAITAALISKTHRLKIFSLIGWAILVLGLGLFQDLNINTSVAAWIFLNVPSGVGIGILFSSVALATQNAAESTGTAEEVSQVKTMAACLNPFFRAIGQAVAIAVGQAAVDNEVKHRLGAAYGNQLAGLAPLVKYLLPDQQAIVKQAFVDSLRVVWWVLFALAISAGLLVSLTADHRILVKPAQDGEKAIKVTDIGTPSSFEPVTDTEHVRPDSQSAK